MGNGSGVAKKQDSQVDGNSPGVKWIARAETLLLYIAFAIILWLAIAAWFKPLQFQVFAGDDVDTFSRNQVLSAPPIRSVAVMYHKFRPVAATVIFGIAKWTKCDFREVASISLEIGRAHV